MYDQETDRTDTRHQREANSLRHTDGKHNPVHLCFSHGVLLSPWSVGERSRQRRDIQNDFTRFFYSYRRHDRLPEWYQTNAK